MNPGFAVWLTGLSGSGKSAIAKALLGQLHERGVDAAVLESDVLRTQLTPFPRYDEAERDLFYATLAKLAQSLAEQGVPVVIDATANLRRYRDAARGHIPRFVEIFVDTPLAVCEARDPKGLYRAARAGGTATLPGLQALYEAPRHPELVVSGESEPQKAATAILELLRRRGWVSG